MSSVSEFQLVNPYIKGNFNKNFTGGSARAVASKVWASLSKNFSSPLKRYYFTIQKAGGKLYHYEVKEKLNGSHIDYTIREIGASGDKQVQQFKSKLAKLQRKSGGAEKEKKKKVIDDEDDDDSSSSSSSSSSESSSSDLYSALRPRYIVAEEPINYYWYDPVIYDITELYVPTFVSPLTPMVQIEMPYFAIPQDTYII